MENLRSPNSQRSSFQSSHHFFTESYWLRWSFNIKVPQDSNACLVECSGGYTESSSPVWRRRRRKREEYTFLLSQWSMMSLPSQLLCHVEEYWDQQQPVSPFPKHSKASFIWNLVHHSLARQRFAEFEACGKGVNSICSYWGTWLQRYQCGRERKERRILRSIDDESSHCHTTSCALLDSS